MPHTLDRCEDLASPDLVNFVLSCIILVGILVSYLPQHYKIIARRSSEGLSAYFILLGTTSGTCAIANILVLPRSRVDIGCCAVNSSFACAAALLGIAQVGVQWSCFFLITLLFLIFIPKPSPRPFGGTLASQPLGTLWRDAIIVVAVSIIHFVLTFLISVIMLAKYSQYLQGWANFLGVVSSILASTQYLPQIWTTWKLKHPGSLSIPMMCIQTPGSFVFATSLAIRLGKAGWSAWIVYIVTGCLQGCLLTMALTFHFQERSAQKSVGIFNSRHFTQESDDEGGTNVEGDETSPLLNNGRRIGPPPRHDSRASNLLAPERLDPDPSSGSSNSDDEQDRRRKGSVKTKNSGRRSTTWFSTRSSRG